MSDPIFPPEILEKIAEAADDDYSVQATICLVSKSLFTFTRPRLYRKFNTLNLRDQSNFEVYLDKVSRNKHLAQLVESFCVLSMFQNLPRDVATAVLSMPNLKHLTLIGKQTTTPMNPYLDIWRDLFQATNIPFQLESLRLNMRGDNAQSFESMSVAIFLRTQKNLQSINIQFQTALITEREIQNLRRAIIDARNWDFILGGRRPIEWLSLEAGGADASQIKRVTAGSPVSLTLWNVKRLRIDAQILDYHNLYFHLRSLEYLICSSFNDNKHRAMLSLIPNLKILCILSSSNNGQKRRAAVEWFFKNVQSLTDVVYSEPLADSGKREYICERYRRGDQVPERMKHYSDYQELVGYESTGL